MNERLVAIKAAIAAFFTALSAFLGWKSVMALDYISGTAAALKAKGLVQRNRPGWFVAQGGNSDCCDRSGGSGFYNGNYLRTSSLADDLTRHYPAAGFSVVHHYRTWQYPRKYGKAGCGGACLAD